MSVANNLFKSSIIYFIGQVLSKIIAFLLVPLYTGFINKGDIGYYDLTITILGIVVPVMFLEIWTGLLRFGLEQSDEAGKRKVTNNALLVAFIALGLYSITYLAAAMVFQFRLPVWIYVYSILWIFQLLILGITRAYGANTLYAVSGVVSVFFNAAVTIIAVMLSDGNVFSLYAGAAVSMAVQIVIINHKFHVLRNFTFRDYDPVFMKTLIVFSLPLSLNSVMYFMMEGFNKVVISYMLGDETLGVYSIGNKVSVALNLVISVFSLSWQETIFKIESREEKEVVYNTGFNLMVKIVGMGVVVLLPIISIIFPYFVLGEDFQTSRNLIPFLMLVIFANALTSILASCFVAEKDNRGNLIAKTVSCLVNVVVLFSLINHINFYASAIALLLANATGIIIQLRLLKKHIVIRPKYSYLFIFIVMFSISFCVYLTDNILMNLIWLLISGFFCLFYLKDFIMKLLALTKGFVVERKS